MLSVVDRLSIMRVKKWFWIWKREGYVILIRRLSDEVGNLIGMV